MSFGGSTGVSKGDQDLGLFSGTLRAAYMLGAQREGLSQNRNSTIRGRRPPWTIADPVRSWRGTGR